MAKRSPPNKGIVKFPEVYNFRVTRKMRAYIRSRGGGEYIRRLVTLDRVGQTKLPYPPSKKP